MINYKQLGLKIGLEFHQRLDTRKLFCKCQSQISENPYFNVTRNLRITAGELGLTDPAAVVECSKGKTFVYQAFKDSTCTVELDECPPQPANPAAVDIALEIALLLNCKIFDEIYFMRKTVIDGSAISGFQRTALVASNGCLETTHGLVGITGVYLEEESSGIVSPAAYRLDRQCIPLVEISTEILEKEPKQIQEIALKLGRLLRATGKVQRGLGTIRQDVNISIKGGARVEIKGVQDIRILDEIIESEIERQGNLIALKGEVKGKKTRISEIHDFSKYFANTKCELIKKKKNAYGIIIEGFGGRLGKYKFGKELAGIARAFGLGGLIHTDEDPAKYQITGEMEKIRKHFKAGPEDAILLVFAEEKAAKEVLKQIKERIGFAKEGVPEETRKALPDGTSEYMRPLPGAHRMYPETDVLPIPLDKKKINELRTALPKSPEAVFNDLVKKGLSEDLASQMVLSKNLKLFNELCKPGVEPTIVANTLENILRNLSREGVDISLFDENKLKELFKAFKEGKFSKEAIPDVLRAWAKQPIALDELLKKEKLEAVGEKEIKEHTKKLAKEVKEDNPQKKFNILMGELMKKYRGKVDGGLIAKIVKEEIGA